MNENYIEIFKAGIGTNRIFKLRRLIKTLIIYIYKDVD